MSISKVNVSSTEHQIVGSPRYATCSTAAATAAKVASIADESSTFVLERGVRICVKFTNANSVANPTLNVGSTGAKAIYWHGAALASSQYWQAGAVVDFVYNGTQWELVGVAKDNNTTYSVATSSANGLMSSDDKTKLDNIATGANKTTVDSALSSTSTNPVQNKVVNSALAGKASSSHTHSTADITSGTLGLSKGGTGSSTGLAEAPVNAIIRKPSNSTDYLYYTATDNGAFYATSENGYPQFGTLPVAQGGTGATTASDARTKLGAFSTSGGTLSGNVTISKESNPFIAFKQGDGSTGYVQVYTSGSKLRIATGFGSAKSISVTEDGYLMLSSTMYGSSLPDAGNAGRIFFKKE